MLRLMVSVAEDSFICVSIALRLSWALMPMFVYRISPQLEQTAVNRGHLTTSLLSHSREISICACHNRLREQFV